MSGGAAARIRRLFEEATDLPVSERAAFLDRACGDDLDTRREVEALLTLVPDTDELPIRPIVDALLYSDGPEPSAAFDCIDEYRLERPLGAGGMGVVYEAFDETLRRKVALKIYAGAALASGDVRERMRREARAAAAINHPNVVTVFAVGEHEGCPYLVMELAGGRTLRDVLREGPLPLPRALQIARELAAGLGAIHRAGIVHRDLKPENVSIGEDGRTRILDFGIAASTLDVRDRGPRDGRRRSGTTPYMSPEQTSGREPDVRSDIFTLGGLFYELVTGKRPFDRETPEETRRAISRDEPNPPRALSPALPARMERIILRCLAKSPGARYPDAGALLTDLERVEMVAHPERSIRPETLPAYSTRFFGRGDERVRLADSLSERRLVTVVGLGGAGKTRFAVEVAAEVADRFADGVRFVSLGEISDPALVTQAFLASVRAREHGRVNHLETLVTALADRELLLLVDNCEHLVSAVRETVAALLARCPGVTVLTTSRERLSIDGEALFPIAPLSAPAAESASEQARRNPLVRLFVDRASSVDREFSLSRENEEHVFEICRRTDGLPLAAELAAAHARMMTPAEILERMKERLALLRKSGADPTDRHRSMRSMIDWSVSQLDEPERAVLRRLTVFRGGWTLEAAEDVCAFDSVSREDVLEHLATLLDKSLVERRVDRADESSGSRYHMLETVREYAAEMVGAEERRSALENHVAHFERLCGGVSWIGPEQALWLTRLGREEPNIRAIFDRAGEMELDAKRLSFFVSKHAGFWVRTGRWREGRRRCAETLGALESQGQASGYHYAFVMGRDGELAQCQGRLDEASRILGDTLARAVEMSDDTLISSVNSTMGTVELFRGELDAARKHYTDSLEYASRGEVTSERDRLHQAWNHAGTLLNRGTTFAQQGRYEEAREDFAESLRIKRELNDTRGIAQALNGLGVLAGKLGRFEEAHELLEESLELKRELGDHLGSVNTLHNLAGMASDRFETLADDSALLDYADRCIDEALALARKLGARPSIVDLVTMRGGVALLREAYAEARTCLEEALASARELNSPLAEAMARMQLAALGVATGDPDTAWEELRAVAPVFHEAHVPWLGQMLEIASEAAVGRGEDESAARLLGASEAIAESHGAVTPPWRRTRTEQQRDALCARLGEVRLRMLEAAGRETAIRDTLAEVLGVPE